MTNENDIITHFSMQGSPPLFLCLLWKMLLETDHINQIGFRSANRFTYVFFLFFSKIVSQQGRHPVMMSVLTI